MTIVDVQKNNAVMADEGSTENAMGTCVLNCVRNYHVFVVLV